MSKKKINGLQKQTQFGALLREIRITFEWTLRKLSEITGINQKTLSEYERGIRLPSRMNMEKIKRAIEIASADYPEIGYDEEELETDLQRLENDWIEDTEKASARRAGQLFRQRA